MAANFPLLQFSSTISLRTKLQVQKVKAVSCKKCKVGIFASASSNGNGRDAESVEDTVKSVEKIIEEKRRAELSARIASGEFTVQKSR